ncbi:MAG: ABC transporter permease [Acidimicrobiia bacterium]|nr:ABC transporter permease [Acidimicrobiia bacterium]MCY4457648.1 ABC transporter permease [Acidimicrobiaceae bacterium]
MAPVTPTQRQRRRIAALLTPGLSWITLVYVVPGGLIVVYSLLTPKLGGGVIWEFTGDAWKEIVSKGRRSDASWGTLGSAAFRAGSAAAIAAVLLVAVARYLRHSARPAIVAAVAVGGLAGVNHLAAAYNNYTAVFARSVVWSLLATVACIGLALPLAVFISSRRSSITKNALLVAVMIPFWTSMLVRTFAIRFTLSNTGPLNNIIESLGFDRQVFLNTRFAVLLGLVYTALPFMVLPLYAATERANRAQLEAARDLGARPLQVFFDVFVPLIRPGLTVGSVMVFVLSVSQYLVPTLLGGGKHNMIANLLDLQFGEAFNWPLGAALAVLFSFITIVSLYFVVGRQDGADLL